MQVPVDRLFDVFVDQHLRGRWLEGGSQLHQRTATRPRTARFDWGDGRTRVNLTFQAKGEAASSVAVEHARLDDPEAAAGMKAWWRDRLTLLKSRLEAGEVNG